MSTISLFKTIETKHDVYRVKIENLKELPIFHNDLPFLPEDEDWKCPKAWSYLPDKTEYAIWIRSLKQALNRGLNHKVIQFNQNTQLKS